MTHNQQTIEQPERDCRHHEQVRRGDAISVVTKKRPPSLRRRTPPSHHILATLVCPTSIPSLRSSPWILGAPHNGLATLIWRMSWCISTVTVGRPQRGLDFHRQYDLNPKRCQRITVSGRTIASASYIFGNSRQTPPTNNLSIETNRSLLGLARRSTLICCLSTRISASSATCDRNRSPTIPKISRHKSSIECQHRAILSQLPARLKFTTGTGLNCRQDRLENTQPWASWRRERNWDRTFSRYSIVGPPHGVGRTGLGRRGTPSPPSGSKAAKRPFCPGGDL
jgi:hypothetical protein